MFRLGIRHIGQFSPRAGGVAGRVRHLLTRGCISYELLGAVSTRGAREVEVFESIVRDLRLTNGVCRTTARGRFSNFDPEVNAVLFRQFRSDTPLLIHDWAASDCLTSSEWARTLLVHYTHRDTRVIASDLLLNLVEVALPGGDLFVLEPSGEPLQYIRGPFVSQLDRPEPFHALINRVLAGQARQKLQHYRGEISAALEELESKDKVVRGDLQLRKLPLIHPDAVSLQASDRRFSIRRHSAFEPLDKPVHVIRTMNIFNRSYFSPEVLGKGAATVWQSLGEGGIWIVGRTSRPDGGAFHHTATIFSRNPEGFAVLSRFEGGSEIEDIVLQLRPAAGRVL